LFELPSPPPNYDVNKMKKVMMRHKAFFKEMGDKITTAHQTMPDALKAASGLPPAVSNIDSRLSKEHKTIMQSLHNSDDLLAAISHDKIGQGYFDAQTFHPGANRVAQEATQAIRESARECASYGFYTPTWTGQCGTAGAPGRDQAPSTSASVSSPLKRKSHVREESSVCVRRESFSIDVHTSLKRFGRMRSANGEMKSADTVPGLPKPERGIAEIVLRFFLDPDLAGEEHQLTTGQVLEYVSPKIMPTSRYLFKNLLHEMCTLKKTSIDGEPGTWSLRKEIWP